MFPTLAEGIIFHPVAVRRRRLQEFTAWVEEAKQKFSKIREQADHRSPQRGRTS